MKSALNYEELKEILISSYRALKKYQKEIDQLNVFPVPDGDTGTNMALTMQKVIEEIEKDKSNSVTGIGKLTVDAALMGARGNSGVILSQILRGFFEKVKNEEELNTSTFYKGIKNSVKVAYQAVRKPVEGTILTVLKEGFKGLNKKSDSILEMVNDFNKGAKIALKNTPNLLPVLKDAGVVDAGGYGLLAMFEGIEASLKGEEIIKTDIDEFIKIPEISKEEEINFIYCTEFMLKSSVFNQEKMENKLAVLGDSILVVGSKPVFRVHVHTDNPDKVLNIALKTGEISQVRINNMKEQMEEIAQEDISKEIGIVVVANGEGFKDILLSLGAGKIIEGGQSMNPSTEEIAEVVKQLKQKKVIILPSNKNIIMSAEAVRDIIDKEVFVIPTKSIPQSIAAVLAFMPESGIKEVVKEMEESIKSITTCEVTQAIRDSSYRNIKIKKDDYIGIKDGEIVTSGKDFVKTSLELIAGSINEDISYITLYVGEQIKKDISKKIKNKLEKLYNECEIELRVGGQPLYQLIAGLE